MKRMLQKMLCVAAAILMLSGCAEKEPNTPDVLVPAVMVEGQVYCTTGEEFPGEVEESALLGKVSSVVPLSQWPEKEGEANFGETGVPYARTEDGLVVLVDQEWTLFTPKE